MDGEIIAMPGEDRALDRVDGLSFGRIETRFVEGAVDRLDENSLGGPEDGGDFIVLVRLLGGGERMKQEDGDGEELEVFH